MRIVGPATILVVDDNEENLKLMRRLLRAGGYVVALAEDGPEALSVAEQERPDLILLDIDMPKMNGFEVCRRLKADPGLRDIPVIFLSALAEPEQKVEAFAVGGADYIVKPFDFAEVQARVRNQLDLRQLHGELEKHNRNLERLVQDQVREISESQMATIFALSKLAESRDDDTGQHLERVRSYCRVLTDRLGENPEFRVTISAAFVQNIYAASPLHDIGKVGIPDSILLKPGKLTKEEFDAMKAHSSLGAETLEAVRSEYPNNSFLRMGIEIARSHHERWDGNGYPDGMAGDDIPLAARVMAVADVYDALRSKRSYKDPFSHEKSGRIIVEGRDSQFDGRVVEAHCDHRFGACGSLHMLDSLIQGSENVGMLLTGTWTVLEGVTVRDTRPNRTGDWQDDYGQGILSTCADWVDTCGFLEMTGCRVVSSFTGGVAVEGVSGSLTSSEIRGVDTQPVDGTYGYGVQVAGKDGAPLTVVHIDACRIADARLAGILYHLSGGILGRTSISGGEFSVAMNQGSSPTIEESNQLSGSSMSEPTWTNMDAAPAPGPALPSDVTD